MNIRIKNSSNDPIYLQIKNQIRDAIINGDLAAEELLPSIRVLAKEIRVSVITTKRAYDELEREGYIHSVQGKGSFVAAQNKELMREKMLKKIEASLLDALRYAKLAEISKEELVNIMDILED
ncbi:MAG TPA: GntR family transcriptional regulator [Christensenellaceae bacterium]|nr:GntR family transcriptional regulator [Christensenellaceae bacterium]